MKAWLTGGFPDMGRDGKMRLGGIIVPEALFSAQHACNPLPIHSTHNYSVLFILQIPKNPIPLHFQITRRSNLPVPLSVLETGYRKAHKPGWRNR